MATATTNNSYRNADANNNTVTMVIVLVALITNDKTATTVTNTLATTTTTTSKKTTYGKINCNLYCGLALRMYRGSVKIEPDPKTYFLFGEKKWLEACWRPAV